MRSPSADGFRNYMKDEGRPFGVGFQDQASNYLRDAVIKSHGDERLRKRFHKR